MGIGEVIAIFWTMNDPPGLKGLNFWLVSRISFSFYQDIILWNEYGIYKYLENHAVKK